MDFLAFKKAYEDHAEVLRQYTLSKTATRETLKDQFSTVLCSFVKKEHFYNVMAEFLNIDYVITDIKTQWAFILKDHLIQFTFENNPEYVDEIIDRVKDCYKIKANLISINNTPIAE